VTRRARFVRIQRCLAVAILLLAGLRGTAHAAPGIPETRTLPNGLRVVLLADRAVPLTSVSLWVGAGSKHEVEASTGYAHFLEHLIQRGAGSTGPFEYTRLSHRWGGGLSVRSNYDRTSITFTGVPQTLPDMLDAAAALALRAAIKDSEVDLELGTLTSEIRTYYDLPASVAFLETMRAAFPEHPYRWPTLGNFRSVGTLRSEPLLGFYRNLYAPNNMALAIVGDFDPKAAMTRVEAAFGPASKSGTLSPPPAPPEKFPGHTDIEKKLDLPGPWTMLAFTGPGYRHPDRLAFETMVAALADPSSGIAAALQADQAGTVSQVSFYGLEDAGMLYIALNPATPELSYKAAAAAMRAIASFKSTGVTEAVLRERIAREVREERLRAVSVQERAERLGESTLFGGARYYWDRPTALRALTPADLSRVASRYLVKDNARLVLLVPKGSGDHPAAAKDAFHDALDRLGAPPGETGPPSTASLYPGAESTRVSGSSWGDPKGAAAPLAPTRSVLPNGLTLIVVEDHRWPFAAASLHLRGGSELDPEGRAGTTALAVRVMAGRAASAMRAAAATARAPLIPEAQAMRDAVEMRFSADPADLATGLGALARAVAEPLPGGELEGARQAALAVLQRTDIDPDAVAIDLFHEKVYAGHPYSHSPGGTMAGVRAVTAEDLAAVGQRMLRPGGAVLAVVGDVEAGAVARQAERLFGDWKGTAAERAKPPAASGDAAASPAATAGAEFGSYSRQMDASQSRVMAGVPGVRAGDPDFAILRALGAGATLLAFDDMVFKRRAAFSALSIPEGFRDGGALALAVLAAPVRGAEAVFDVQRLMRRLALEPLGADDARDIGRVLAGREASVSQSGLSLASGLAWREVIGAGVASWRDDLSGTAPRPDRMQALAERLIRADGVITIVVGPPSS
jgi:zinc protease